MTIVNRDQAEHWNDSQATGDWVINQERYDRMLEPFTGLLLDAIALAPGERVLDVGCGCGTTTVAAAAIVAPGTAVGVDLSVPMLTRARENARSSGPANVSFEEGDAQVYTFVAKFDAVISRFGVMFFADPVAAFANLRAATRPGGRLAFVCWQPWLANEWLVVPGAAMAEHVPLPDFGDSQGPGMFALSEPDRTRRILGDAGWQQVDLTSWRTSLLIGGGTLDDAIAYLRGRSMTRRILGTADAATQERAIQSVREVLARHADASGVHLGAAVWLVQARA
jgi:SAM-dependent methyltransferase